MSLLIWMANQTNTNIKEVNYQKGTALLSLQPSSFPHKLPSFGVGEHAALNPYTEAGKLWGGGRGQRREEHGTFQEGVPPFPAHCGYRPGRVAVLPFYSLMNLISPLSLPRVVLVFVVVTTKLL